jgi:hypothetical protein
MTMVFPLGHELEAEWRFRVIGERNLLLSMEVSFFVMPFYGEVMHMRNMEMSFFPVCPFHNCECKAPKIGMNCNQSLIILFLFDSSRFSGQTSRIYKGIQEKKTSPCSFQV